MLWAGPVGVSLGGWEEVGTAALLPIHRRPLPLWSSLGILFM